MAKKNNISVNPPVGFGTSGLPDSRETSDLIFRAIESGYRMIDTAAAYGNEKSIGVALNRCKWNDLLVVGKIANETRSAMTVENAYQKTIEAFGQTLENLQLSYLDIYLIHWPIPQYTENHYTALNNETWRAMTHLKNKGFIRHIGVSNFLPRHIEALEGEKPEVNQIEVHPFYQQNDLAGYCHGKGIDIHGWGVFKQGRIFDEPTLVSISKRYCKTVSQLVLRFIIQQNIIPIFKSSNLTRINENMDIFDFEISEQDIKTIESLDTPNGYFQNYSYDRMLKF